MTSQKDQIQRLIAEIDATLAKPVSRLPLGLSGEAERQRQLLGKLFSYLQSLEQMFESPGGWGPIDPGTGQFVSPPASVPDVEESASQVLQGLLTEMRYLRENSLRPMRQELESLQQKRDSLQAEINVLEAQRVAEPLQSEQQINAFLETLMQRLQEQLSAQMVQNFAAMEAATMEQLAAADNPAPMMSGQRLEQVRLLQAQSDQLLLKLDSTLTAVFDSLQKSVDSYRESLEQGLDQMHGLGRQGEVIFHAFINHLAQQLGQDASSYLAGGLSETSQPSSTLQQQPGAVTTDVDLDAIQLDELDQALEGLSLEEEGPEVADQASSLEVDSDLSELELLEQAIAPDEDEEITLIQSNDLSENDLSELEFLEDAIAADEDITLIQSDRNLGQEIEFDLDEEITLIQDDEPNLDLDFLDAAVAPAGRSPDAAEPANLPADEGELDDSDESTPLNLELSLEDIDENLGLLAVGDESSELLSLGELGDASNQDELPQESPESELFNFDADFDLGLEPLKEGDEPTVDLLAGSLFPDETKTAGLSDDFLDFNLEDSHEEEAASAALPTDAEPSVETDLTEPDIFDTANQVADDWLFEQAGPVITDDDVIPEATVDNLFGDSIAPRDGEVDDTTQAGSQSDVVVSLSEVLPDELPREAAEEFPENVPDDVYIAAAADEDLINLVQPGTEQRLLIDFDDEQLVEQLDEDLQKLAGDTFAADYGVDEDDALEPLDQATLETIVRDLDLEDLDLDVGQSAEATESRMAEVSPIEQDDERAAEAPQASDDGFDLFEGFAEEVVDVDDPSGDESDVAIVTSLTEPEPDNLDLLGLVADPLMDDFDDGLTDSLADELGGLNEQSKALSQQPAEEIVGQILSDLEEPAVPTDEAVIAPVVEDTEPALESASLPDVPSALLMDDPSSGSPETDDFLQAEQAAFWQTLTEDDGSQPPASQISDNVDIVDLLNESELVSDASDERATSEDLALDAASVSAAEDLEDLLGLNDLSPDLATASRESGDDENIDLDDLDELFGQSPLPELEALTQEVSTVDEAETPNIDPLAALGLDVTAPPESLQETPLEALIPNLVPQIDEAASVPIVMASVDAAAEPTDTTSESEVAEPPTADTPIDVSVHIEGDWFLGLDVGSTGLSAVLMDRQTGQVYPLYWQIANEETKHFRLPAMALMTSAHETVAVGYDALGDLGNNLLDTFGATTSELVGVNRLKPLLKVAVGHGQTLADSDPWLRWSDTVELPMLQVLQAMVALLKSVVEKGQAVGLDSPSLKQIWEKLQGVVVGYPINWPDTYSFNLREAVLAAGLIDQPEQILFVEDAIATVLSGLPDPNDAAVAETVSLSRQPSLYNYQWQEGTVVINGGAVMTELGLVNLPKDLTNLNYADFALRGFAYGGDALDQDIVCQLLLPEERRQPLTDADASISWDWQGHLAPEDAGWEQLTLDGLTLPAVGHVDWTQRYQLQQRLLASSLGQSLLAAARHLKLALQQQNQLQLTLAGQRWLIKRRHLENLIFLPYIQRINRYLNVLLSHHSVDTQAIKQVVCTGGSASLPAIARWLRQKFPNATIIQDTYASELPHSCSRVAYGLVNLARYPQVLNITRQQYSDYFLLMELLRVFPQQPLPVGAIMHLLEQRGINTQACHLHILALLEGHLPPGLVPTAADRGLICDRTTDLPTYRALLQTPLFSKTFTESGGQMYIPNETQAEQLRAYVSRLLVNKVQTLEEPLIAQLEVFA